LCSLLLLACASSKEPPATPVAVANVEESTAARPESAPPSTERIVDRPVIPLLHPRKTASWLGLELHARPRDEAGVEVRSVLRGSPSYGVLEAGDVLLSLDGETVNAPVDLVKALHHHEPGTSVGIGFLRGGKQRLTSVLLEGAPEVEDRARLEWIGLEAPEIASVVTFQGETASLAEMRGKVVVLEFWAKYCGVCRMMAPLLDDWHRTLAPAGLRVVGITMDTPADGAEAAAESHMSYPLASDPHGDITKSYHATQIPMLLILDRRGVVRDVVIGYSTPRLRATEKLLDELLREEVPAARAN
jgi:peroxiredoxin